MNLHSPIKPRLFCLLLGWLFAFGLIVYNWALVYKFQNFFKVVVHLIYIIDQCNQTGHLTKSK